MGKKIIEHVQLPQFLSNLNAKLAEYGIVGQYGVAGRNESGEHLLETCAEQE